VTDRVKKRSLLIVTQLANMVITLVVAAFIATGVTFAVNAPGRQSFVPELVPRRQLMNAIGGAGAIVVVFVLTMGIFRSSLRRLQ
jgi:hypothetical protein